MSDLGGIASARKIIKKHNNNYKRYFDNDEKNKLRHDGYINYHKTIKKNEKDMINIQVNTFQKIKNHIDEKYDDLFYYNKFRDGITLSITDENNNLYGFINDDIEIPIFIPNQNIGIAADSFNKYLEYKGLNEKVIKFENAIKTIFLNKPKLKIERYGVDDVLTFDFSIILKKDETLIHKGKKIRQDYIDDNDDIIVSKYYEDVIGNRIIFGKLSENRIIGMKIRIVWWSEGNEVGLEKTVNVKKFSRQEEGERLKTYRSRQIANLKGLAMGTDAEQVVDLIYAQYDDEIYRYINHGTNEFLTALNNEVDPIINHYLNISIPNINICDIDEEDFYLLDNYYYYNDKITYDNCIAKMQTPILGSLKSNDISISIEISLEDEYYKLKIIEPGFTPSSGNYIIIYNNIIKDYIQHEIDIDIK